VYTFSDARVSSPESITILWCAPCICTVIDLEAFGFGGVLPDVLSKAISSVREQEPLIWNSVLSDPVAKRYLEDPMLAVKEALDVAKDYGEAMMKSS